MRTLPSLDGRVFTAVVNDDGEVGSSTRFRYTERSAVVHADYAGGDVVRGFLVGTRDGDQLDFRYAHLNTQGITSTGHCVTRVEELPDGRLRLHETWEWESRDGKGTSIVEEIPRDS
ncbi:hypothetical protein LKO27_10500 [Tessaracoccus sp. OS52]|uniref:hypothetical protein n=1 Tax=Tessaracoccus sp. OS52 TaxID=2886691 RepID=UPI001D12B21B|nr:hypothetical protein [Tessaracoccus sp. OS52]MCC2593834.1 hypothetical protein [Tessaracoccus sp. OS52]